MFSRLLSSWRKQRQRRTEHIASFGRVSAPNADGVTLFQLECIAAMEGVIPNESFERALHADGTVMFVAAIPETDDKLFIYDTEVGIHGPDHDWCFEEWNFKTPEELIASVLKSITKPAT